MPNPLNGLYHCQCGANGNKRKMDGHFATYNKNQNIHYPTIIRGKIQPKRGNISYTSMRLENAVPESSSPSDMQSANGSTVAPTSPMQIDAPDVEFQFQLHPSVIEQGTSTLTL